jgi:hypothetical protein
MFMRTPLLTLSVTLVTACDFFDDPLVGGWISATSPADSTALTEGTTGESSVTPTSEPGTTDAMTGTVDTTTDAAGTTAMSASDTTAATSTTSEPDTSTGIPDFCPNDPIVGQNARICAAFRADGQTLLVGSFNDGDPAKPSVMFGEEELLWPAALDRTIFVVRVPDGGPPSPSIYESGDTTCFQAALSGDGVTVVVGGSEFGEPLHVDDGTWSDAGLPHESTALVAVAASGDFLGVAGRGQDMFAAVANALPPTWTTKTEAGTFLPLSAAVVPDGQRVWVAGEHGTAAFLKSFEFAGGVSVLHERANAQGIQALQVHGDALFAAGILTANAPEIPGAQGDVFVARSALDGSSLEYRAFTVAGGAKTVSGLAAHSGRLYFVGTDGSARPYIGRTDLALSPDVEFATVTHGDWQVFNLPRLMATECGLLFAGHAQGTNTQDLKIEERLVLPASPGGTFGFAAYLPAF